MKNVILKTASLNKTFESDNQKQTVLNDLDFEIYDGDFTIIMGASGSGKSTLLYALSGMDSPTSGRISFLDQNIETLNSDKLSIFRRKNCGFVFQQMFLLDSMSILDNILVSGLLVQNDKKEVIHYAKELLERVGINEPLWSKLPSQLSGGENQRVAIVRSLINKPKVVFADEPTGALNSASGQDVLNILSELNDKGQSIVMVTHDLISASRGNRILYIKDGVIGGECDLGKYQENDKKRQEKLLSFLLEMGW